MGGRRNEYVADVEKFQPALGPLTRSPRHRRHGARRERVCEENSLSTREIPAGEETNGWLASMVEVDIFTGSTYTYFHRAINHLSQFGINLAYRLERYWAGEQAGWATSPTRDP